MVEFIALILVVQIIHTTNVECITGNVHAAKEQIFLQSAEDAPRFMNVQLNWCFVCLPK